MNTADGLFYIGGQKPVLVCGTPVVPVALFCGKDKESSLGIRLMTGNGLGKYVKALVRFEDIVQSGAQVVGKLADRGFCVGSSPQQFALFDRFPSALPEFTAACLSDGRCDGIRFGGYGLFTWS
ncbi:hypothetical protein CSC04_0037 [Enterobacter roggenkampii]|nr:hypothetical protein CSC04_0037 [Enterobacter roggenkampii]